MKFILSLLIVIPFLNINAQQYDWQPLTREVVISQGDSTIRAKILIKQENVNANENYMYYWHNKGRVNNNAGGYAGELLHGEYLVFDSQKRLITQGMFEDGLKEGIWKHWHPNGQLEWMQTYHKGLFDGEQKIFDVSGNLIAETNYKNGRLVAKEDKSFKITKWGNAKSETDTIPNQEINLQ